MTKRSFIRTYVAFSPIHVENKKDRNYVLRFIQYGRLLPFHVKGLERRLRVANLEDFDKLASFVSEYWYFYEQQTIWFWVEPGVLQK